MGALTSHGRKAEIQKKAKVMPFHVDGSVIPTEMETRLESGEGGQEGGRKPEYQIFLNK